MDSFKQHMMDMDVERDELYDDCIELCRTFANNDMKKCLEFEDERDKKCAELVDKVCKETAEEISSRYNLNKDFCVMLANRMRYEEYCAFSEKYSEVKRYAEFARFILDKHEKGEV